MPMPSAVITTPGLATPLPAAGIALTWDEYHMTINGGRGEGGRSLAGPACLPCARRGYDNFQEGG